MSVCVFYVKTIFTIGTFLYIYNMSIKAKTLTVINTCRNAEQLKGAVRYARLAMLENHLQVQVAIISQAHALGLSLDSID